MAILPWVGVEVSEKPQGRSPQRGMLQRPRALMGRAKAKATAALASKRGHDDFQSPLTPTPLGSNGNFDSSKATAGFG
jgi:hypothetical protein